VGASVLDVLAVIAIGVSIYAAILVPAAFVLSRRARRPVRDKSNDLRQPVPVTMKVVSDDVLSATETIYALAAVEVFCRQQAPSYIVGVYRSGWLLAD
jgi:hypothetical protein